MAVLQVGIGGDQRVKIDVVTDGLAFQHLVFSAQHFERAPQPGDLRPVFGQRIGNEIAGNGIHIEFALAGTLPFVIWMMLTFIEEVPYTLEHAARMMGAGRMYTLRRVVLPLVGSGMVVTFLFVFILNWAEFLLALTLTHPDVVTLPVLLNKFQSASEGRLFGPQAAIGTIITIPVVVLGMFIQKHLIKGFSFGTIRK